MAHVVCLIADPERTPLDRVMVATLERTLGATVRWLAPDEACELPVDHHDPVESRRRIEATLAPELPHAVVLPAHSRRKRLLVNDMIAVECIDELTDYSV